jgi:hypothetical protein
VLSFVRREGEPAPSDGDGVSVLPVLPAGGSAPAASSVCADRRVHDDDADAGGNVPRRNFCGCRRDSRQELRPRRCLADGEGDFALSVLLAQLGELETVRCDFAVPLRKREIR